MKNKIKIFFISLLCFCSCSSQKIISVSNYDNFNSNDIPIEYIEWNTSSITETENVDVKIEKFSKEKKSELGIENDAYLRCTVFNFNEPLIINIKCRAKPNNTPHSKLAYDYTTSKNVDYSYVETSGLYLTFYGVASLSVNVVSIENKNINYLINIDVLLHSFEF